MSKIMDELKREYQETKKSSIIVYFILRFLVILCLVRQIMLGHLDSALLCVLSLFLLLLPIVIQRRFKITLPNALETIIYIFIFAAEILGEIYNFYGHIANWDLMLHTLNGFLCAAIGFSLIDILNNSERFHIKLSPVFVALVAFCFSMTIGVLWEFFEYGADQFLNYDMQKDTIVQDISTVTLDPEGKNRVVTIDDINKTTIYSTTPDGQPKETSISGGYLDIGLKDTMGDLIVNFIGAIVFSAIGFFYIQNRDKYKFAENFIPVKRFSEKE